jgi:uncharacterized protein (TIGR03000 family)
MALLVLPLAAAKAQYYDTFEVLRLQDRTVYIFPKGYAPNVAVPYAPIVNPYFQPTVAVASPWLSSNVVLPQSYYGAADPASLPSSTSITLRLPADAEVWIQGKKTEEKGTERRFTLSLDSGRTYDYEVRVSWPENGHPVTRTSHLSLRTGDQQSITYVAALASRKPATTEEVPTPPAATSGPMP